MFSVDKRKVHSPAERKSTKDYVRKSERKMKNISQNTEGFVIDYLLLTIDYLRNTT